MIGSLRFDKTADDDILTQAVTGTLTTKLAGRESKPGLGEDIRPVGAEAVIPSAVAALFRAAY